MIAREQGAERQVVQQVQAFLQTVALAERGLVDVELCQGPAVAFVCGFVDASEPAQSRGPVFRLEEAFFERPLILSCYQQRLHRVVRERAVHVTLQK